MNNYYIIADTHFGHKNIIEYCGRPDTFEKITWNNLRLLGETDTLIHLGDFAFRNVKENCLKIWTLNCKKILVMGNHDHESKQWYMKNGWDCACDGLMMIFNGKKIFFSHRPEEGYYDINIHGHFHNKPEKTNDNQILFSLEAEKYRPIELNSFINKRKKNG